MLLPTVVLSLDLENSTPVMHCVSFAYCAISPMCDDVRVVPSHQDILLFSLNILRYFCADVYPCCDSRLESVCFNCDVIVIVLVLCESVLW